MCLRCSGEAKARKGASLRREGQRGREVPSSRDPGDRKPPRAGLPGRGRARAVLTGPQSPSRPHIPGPSATYFLDLPALGPEDWFRGVGGCRPKELPVVSQLHC